MTNNKKEKTLLFPLKSKPRPCFLAPEEIDLCLNMARQELTRLSLDSFRMAGAIRLVNLIRRRYNDAQHSPDAIEAFKLESFRVRLDAILDEMQALLRARA